MDGWILGSMDRRLEYFFGLPRYAITGRACVLGLHLHGDSDLGSRLYIHTCLIIPYLTIRIRTHILYTGSLIEEMDIRYRLLSLRYILVEVIIHIHTGEYIICIQSLGSFCLL